eukprot:scaffold108109_cov34-Prasinocladus_malaysianus.AAC.1
MPRLTAEFHHILKKPRGSPYMLPASLWPYLGRVLLDYKRLACPISDTFTCEMRILRLTFSVA